MPRYSKHSFQIGEWWLSQRDGSPAWYATFYDAEAKRAFVGDAEIARHGQGVLALHFVHGDGDGGEIGPQRQLVRGKESAASQGEASSASRLLGEATDRLRLSARGYHRVLRVARTLADLAASAAVRRIHIAEALSYRRILLGADLRP